MSLSIYVNLLTIEVGETVLALYLITDESELPVCDLIVLEISEGYLVYTSLQTIRGNLCSDSTGHQGLTNLADVEHGWSLYIIPILLGERVDTKMER